MCLFCVALFACLFIFQGEGGVPEQSLTLSPSMKVMVLTVDINSYACFEAIDKALTTLADVQV